MGMHDFKSRKKVIRNRNHSIRLASRHISKNSRKRKRKEAQSPDLHGPVGFFLICCAIITVISLVWNLSTPSSNVLGKYLGQGLASLVVAFAGTIPAFLIPIVLFLMGWNLLSRIEPALSYRRLFLTMILLVEFCVLLSIRNLGEGKSWEQFYATGGLMGNFIVQNLLSLVFGVQKIGAFFIMILITLGTLMWGFRVDVYQLIIR